MSYKGTKIQVTEEDIKNGICASMCNCPVALAVKRAIPDARYVSVNDDDIVVDAECYRQPLRVWRFAYAFDFGKHVEPFEFTLGKTPMIELPDEFDLEVTQEDIDKAIRLVNEEGRLRTFNCPIACAINRNIPEGLRSSFDTVAVQRNNIAVVMGSGVSLYDHTDASRAFIKAFDSGKEVKPFKDTLKPTVEGD